MFRRPQRQLSSESLTVLQTAWSNSHLAFRRAAVKIQSSPLICSTLVLNCIPKFVFISSAPRKSNRDDYDPEYDDSYSEYSRSESRRGRYHSDERERSERRHSRRRGKSSQKHSRGKDLDIRDYNDYIEYYRDYYRDYYRRRSESSGSSDSHRRGTPSGHSSGAQTPRSCSSRSSSRADRSHRSKHHRSYDYEDG